MAVDDSIFQLEIVSAVVDAGRSKPAVLEVGKNAITNLSIEEGGALLAERGEGQNFIVDRIPECRVYSVRLMRP